MGGCLWPTLVPAHGARLRPCLGLRGCCAVPVCHAGAGEECKDVFQRHPFVRLVELPTATSLKSISAFELAGRTIFQDGSVHGVVRPDLPLKPSWSQFLRVLGFRGKFGELPRSEMENDGSTLAAATGTSFGQSQWQVRTVAAHTASMPELCNRMVEFAGAIEEEGGGGSLLLLTGEHSFRRWPGVNKLLPGNAFALLKAARDLRRTGHLPPGVQLWAVENPLTNPVDRMEQKIAAGAEAIILQPPLLPDRFQDWWAAADKKGLLKSAHVIVGLPMISSAKNLAFWLQLTRAAGKEAENVIADFLEAERTLDRAQLDLFYESWNRKLIQLIKSLPDVAGMHVMPVTPRGWRQFAALISSGKM